MTPGFSILQSGNEESDLLWVEAEGKTGALQASCNQQMPATGLGFPTSDVVPYVAVPLAFPLFLDEGTEAQSGSELA